MTFFKNDVTPIEDEEDAIVYCQKCGALIPNDGNCWYCENKALDDAEWKAKIDTQEDTSALGWAGATDAANNWLHCDDALQKLAEKHDDDNTSRGTDNRWLYCFLCQASHLHHWTGKKWQCSNCESTRISPGPDTPTIDNDIAAVLGWAGAGAEEGLKISIDTGGK